MKLIICFLFKTHQLLTNKHSVEEEHEEVAEDGNTPVKSKPSEVLLIIVTLQVLVMKKLK